MAMRLAPRPIPEKAPPVKAKSYLACPMPATPQFQNLTGQRYGAVTVTRFLGKQQNKAYWEYRCDCGNVGSTASGNLKLKKSCGCHQRKALAARNRTHGYTTKNARTPEYIVWAGMRARCLNPNEPAFHLYGGRGITICESWKDDFRAFLEDMGPRPSMDHSIDRIENDGNYEPGNCRWATWKQQQNNRSSCHYVLIDKQRMTLQQACDLAQLADVCVYARLSRGWGIVAALTIPSARTRKGGLPASTEIEDERDGI
jgi:hypothetical protein